MKERPILMSGPMVRAILDGPKTQTRRVVKFPIYWSNRNPPSVTDAEDGDVFCCPDILGDGRVLVQRTSLGNYHCMGQKVFAEKFSPYGVPGDRLWVRETFKWVDGERPEIYYAASDTEDGPWKPSIFMPRHLSRLTLEIMKIRVERLQDISYLDCKAEGVETLDEYEDAVDRASAIGCGTGDIGRQIYEQLWDSINGKKHPWANNDWVWVVEFRKATE